MDDMFIYDCNLNIEGFVHMLDDPTQCYKFYWLDSIMQLLSEQEENITFDKVISGMIADAWYSVTEYHLRMGTKDAQGNSTNSIEKAVNKLDELDCLDHTADRQQILCAIESNEKLLHKEKYQITKDVPYRLLSSFMKELGGNDPLWSQRTRLVSYIKLINKNSCIAYTIGTERGLKKKIYIEDKWKHFLIDNMVAIRGWIQMKKIKYLQDRNPGVPGIIYKLEAEDKKQRKLQNVRKLWAAVIDVIDVSEIYSKGLVGKKKYDIDHFVPWSFVANDEIWNLMPVDESLNSSKGNKLPDWQKYFEKFAGNQFKLNQAVHTHERLAYLFGECRRDNLNALWPMEELYIKNIEKDRFMRVLENRLKPIYDSARTQGYGIWLWDKKEEKSCYL
ncbi:MAG TPA: HNH endonuclease [Lachnospiraceae bacterium]|nr:HNH endonuclease [Lachnospiraceae bacterium]